MTKNEFIKSFSALCEVFEKQPSDALIDIYYNLLKKLTDEQFSRAIGQLLMERKYTKMPLPAEILEKVGGSVEDRAIIAVDVILAAIEKHGSYASIVFYDNVINHVIKSQAGGWVKLCETSYEDWHFLRKDLLKQYVALSSRKADLIPIECLPGRAQIENGVFNQHHPSQNVKRITNAVIGILPDAEKEAIKQLETA